MSLSRDLRFAIRQLRKTPAFSFTLILTLALGIGAITLVFSLIESILLRPLPFRDANRLVALGDHLREGPNISVTAREIPIYSSATTAFSSMGAYINAQFELSGGANPENLQGARVTASTFPTLGVDPMIGRAFTPAEDAGAQPVVVISYALWLNRFHRDPNVLGTHLTLDRKSFTIVGVMPRSFDFPLAAGRLNQVQLWVPLSLTAKELSPSEAGFWGYSIVARLKDGVTIAQAAADTERVAQQVMRTFPQSMAAIHIRGDVRSLHEDAVSDARTLLRILFLAVAVLLLVVCVNVAVLLLVRAIRRRREYAVRLALGARAGDVTRQSVCEGLALSITGGLLGLLLTAVALPAVVRVLPDSLPRLNAVGIDTRVAGFALLLTFVTGILSSLAPAFAAVNTNLLESLKQSAPTGTQAGSHQWLRSALVVSEIAIALVLLNAAGVLLRSYQKMLAVDPGFHPDHVVVAAYQLPERQYSSNSSIENFNRAVLERLSAQPGTAATGITTTVPATDGFAMATYTVEGPSVAEWKLQFAQFALVHGDYFRTLGIPLLEGRYFSSDDRDSAPLVVIVNQSFATRWWPGQSPVGKRLHVGNPDKGLPWATVAGVVADVRSGSRDEAAGEQMYFSLLQPAVLRNDAPGSRVTYPRGGYITVRSQRPLDQLASTVRGVVADIDPQLALTEVRTMNEAIANVEAPRRFNTSLISIFAAGALLLAIIGIYAVVAFTVSLREQEIAIRMALGAQRENVARLVLSGGSRMAVTGCAIGLAGSAAVSRIIRSFLFEVSPTDPLIYAASVALMILLALVACAVPALRAASADPVTSLRTT